jgi:hypothetical protein
MKGLQKITVFILLWLFIALPTIQAQAQNYPEAKQILQAIKEFHKSRGENWNDGKKYSDHSITNKTQNKAIVLSILKKQYESMGESDCYILNKTNGAWKVIEFNGLILKDRYEEENPELRQGKNKVNIPLRD